jgi:hypothetical protein
MVPRGGLEPQFGRQQKSFVEHALSCLPVSWNNKEEAASYKKNKAETVCWQIRGKYFAKNLVDSNVVQAIAGLFTRFEYR